MIYLTHYRTACTTNVDVLDDIGYPQKVHWFPETYENLSKGTSYVPHNVAKKVLDQQLIKSLRENKVGKTAFILGGGSNTFCGFIASSYDNKLSYTYKLFPLTLTQVWAGRLAQLFGADDHVSTDASACASSLKVMMEVQTLIRFYGFDRVIVLSVEDSITNSSLDFFSGSKISVTLKDEAAGAKPSAFDKINHGFYLGQGAVLAVFDSEKVVERTGDKPYAKLCGAYTSSEACSNAIGQREDGEGFIKAIEGVVSVSNCSVRDISIVKTHGTGTVSNNASEGTALKATLKEFVATSYKQRIGHTMGPSGLLETCLLLDDIRNNVVPEILNRTEKDDVFLSHPVEPPEGLILTLGAGMGNIYGAAIFEAMGGDYVS
jgi:3-oxoacyl-[acyl-carrier-protein] synthase-1